MRWLSLGLLVVMLSSPVSVRADTRFALVIGHNLGNTDEEPLRFAERDASRVKDTLVQLGEVDEARARLLLAPTIGEVKTVLDSITEEMKTSPDPWLLVYFGGHGDQHTLHLGNESLSRKDLLAWLRKLPGRLSVVILDACQTTRVGRHRGVGSGPSFEIGVLEQARHEGLVVIQSSRLGEPAQESDVLGSAVFTHYLISALRGSADRDNDGAVTLLEAYRFAYHNTVRGSARASEVVQHPSFEIDLAGSGDLVLTRPRKADARLVFPPGPEGRYLVFHRPSGRVVAEVIASEDSPVELAVPSGELLIQRRLSERFYVARVSLPYGGRLEVEKVGFTEKPYELVARRGGSMTLAPWRLSGGYQFRLDVYPGGSVPRHSASFAIDREMHGFTLGASFSLGYSLYDQTFHHNEEVDLLLTARIGWHTSLGAVEFGLQAGPALGLLYQERKRQDPGSIQHAGLQVPPRRYNLSMGIGAQTGLFFRLPLVADFSAIVRLDSMLLARRVRDGEDTSLRAIWVFSGGAGIGMKF